MWHFGDDFAEDQEQDGDAYGSNEDGEGVIVDEER